MASNNEHEPSSRKRKREDAEVSPWGNSSQLLVGHSEQKFVVHNHVLRKAPFFRACLDVEMRENAEGVIKLPADQPGAVEQLVYWLYHDRLEWNIIALMAKEDHHNLSQDFKDKYKTVFDLYYLSDKLMCEKLHNVVIDIIQGTLKSLSPGAAQYWRLCTDLNSEKPLWRLMQQYVAYGAQSMLWIAYKESRLVWKDFAKGGVDNMEFVVDAIMLYPKARNPALETDRCRYHVHVHTQRCGP